MPSQLKLIKFNEGYIQDCSLFLTQKNDAICTIK